MSIDLWVGAATTLAGGLLGGTITLVANHQQMKSAQVQRQEIVLEENYRRSVDRRFQAYTEFLTRARTYRDSIRASNTGSGPRLSTNQIDEYALSADTASAFVYLVSESSTTYVACGAIMRALGEIQTELHKHPDMRVSKWQDLSDKMADALRQFQVAARAELKVGGIEPTAILTRVSNVTTDQM